MHVAIIVNKIFEYQDKIKSTGIINDVMINHLFPKYDKNKVGPFHHVTIQTKDHFTF